MRSLPYLLFLACAYATEPSYVGSGACSQCHRDIATAQSKSSMGSTWHGAVSSALPADYRRTKTEGSVQYAFVRNGNRVRYDVVLPGHAAFKGPVETIIGGQRHGYSFLVRVPEIDGIKLERAPLIETRYLHYGPSGQLALSPGFPEQAPTKWETAMGRVLSPEFEQKCLNCHGAAQKPSSETGVRCESCHGAGSTHLAAVAANAKDKAILNPKKLGNPERLEQCAQCHAGFSEIQDPAPDDLLISNQVNALKNSQCYIQSGAGLSCVSCHSPHHDGTSVDSKTVCLSCHSSAVEKRAALCPVNKTSGCVGCHMPEVKKGTFHMADHWIRVHPEQGVKATKHEVSDRTRVRPKRLYVRWIVAEDAAKAKAAHQELVGGAPFFTVAQKYSTDNSSISGGWLGDMAVADMDTALAETAVKLDRGQFSGVVDIKGKPTFVYRMSRDFLYEADQLQLEATRLRERGSLAEASAKYLESLQVYPYFLRSLIFLAVSVGQQGDAGRAAGILQFASQLYPRDPAAQYNLGIACGSLGRTDDEIRAYRSAIDLQVDLIPAYLNLGGTLYAAGRLDEAAEVYRRGLQQNPLTASLYYNLSQVFQQQNKLAEAKQAASIAAKLDPEYAKAAGTLEGAR